jgi:hypothetical protein
MRRNELGSVLLTAEQCKLLDAVDSLVDARESLHAAAACARDSSRALRNEAAQAQRRSAELLRDAARLVGQTEELLADARALGAEHRLGAHE